MANEGKCCQYQLSILPTQLLCVFVSDSAPKQERAHRPCKRFYLAKILRPGERDEIVKAVREELPLNIARDASIHEVHHENIFRALGGERNTEVEQNA
ncbi:hypothetical protein OESDEN_17773 [Oesophagostomum dentatum]|uniref:Uncharacterized protein n=1 Tax=Oesophagostomum dentatum TaxID=61180 RepID=A0A0B1SB52_OESDE|nr:hypothetical protein OESDEN_17773 [Oesophagostomum dentatum]